MLVNDQAQEADNKPGTDFMEYIKNMNINQISNNYVAGNSIGKQDSQPSDKKEIPQEYKGLNSSQLECNIKKLQKDMEAELRATRLRYETKINSMTDAMKLIKDQEQQHQIQMKKVKSEPPKPVNQPVPESSFMLALQSFQPQKSEEVGMNRNN